MRKHALFHSKQLLFHATPFHEEQLHVKSSARARYEMCTCVAISQATAKEPAEQGSGFCVPTGLAAAVPVRGAGWCVFKVTEGFFQFHFHKN